MLDPNIAMGIKGIQLNDPMEQYGKAMALSQMAQQNQYMQQRMDEQNRATTLGQMRGQAYMQSGGDASKLRDMLAANGDYEGLQSHDQSQIAARKAQSEMGGKLIELRAKAAQFGYTGGTIQHAQQAAQLLAQSGDMEGAQHIMQAVQQFPDATPEQVRQFFQPHLALGQTPEALLNPKYQDIGGQLIDINPNTKSGAINKTQTPESVASNQVAREGHQVTREGHQVTVRGQNLVNDREAEKNKIAGNQPKLTEIQAKGQLYGTRAQAAHENLVRLQGKYSPLAVNTKIGATNAPVIGGIAGPIANNMISKESQMAEQSQRDFVNAILRQESGAVISEPEFKNAQQQYFPQPGDSKEVIRQKHQNRERAIKGLDVMSGPAGGFSKPAQQQSGGFGQRPDGTEKGSGWLGVQKSKSGNDMTEYTVGVPIKGKQMDIPTFVPGLTPQEIEHLKTEPDLRQRTAINNSIMNKAIRHAEKQVSQGKSVFAPTSQQQSGGVKFLGFE